jgi:hypothetical protein
VPGLECDRVSIAPTGRRLNAILQAVRTAAIAKRAETDRLLEVVKTRASARNPKIYRRRP